VTQIAVLALGGNALTRDDQVGAHEQQNANADEMARVVAGLLDSHYQVVITHGNGPQVGSLAIQNEATDNGVPAQPLFVLGAMTQGQIGSLLALALAKVTGGSAAVVAVVTHALVDPEDPAFDNPTKPIGPFFGDEVGPAVAGEGAWQMVQDSGRGLRRVVASPLPKAIIEADAIRTLVEAGFVVIAAGGGGIPVTFEDGHLAGIDAVIDKDFSAERLATALRAEVLMLLTGVDRVALDFGTPTERTVDELTLEDAKRHLDEGQFAPGSMGPKVAAAIRFLERGGKTAIITSPKRAAGALAGRNGTRIVNLYGTAPRVGTS